MHGQRDDIVPFYHGYRLHKLYSKSTGGPAFSYFPARAGHNDLVESNLQMYFGELSNFIRAVRDLETARAEGGADAAGGKVVEPAASVFPAAPTPLGGIDSSQALIDTAAMAIAAVEAAR